MLKKRPEQLKVRRKKFYPQVDTKPDSVILCM